MTISQITTPKITSQITTLQILYISHDNIPNDNPSMTSQMTTPQILYIPHDNILDFNP